MKSYLFKWAIAGLAIPATLIMANHQMSLPDELIIALWPSAIVLMALDTNQPASTLNVMYVWSVSLSLSVAMYVAVGLVLTLAAKTIRKARG